MGCEGWFTARVSTCAELDDGASWRRLLGALVADCDDVVGLFLGDKRSLPPSLPVALRAAWRVLEQGSPMWRALKGDDARALFSGVAAHAISRMPSLISAGGGVMLATLAHAIGWPIPVGGSKAISEALVADLLAHGGELILGEIVARPPEGVVVYDTAPTGLLAIFGDALPSRYAQALRRYRFGPGAAKVDFVLSGEIPWHDSRLARAPMLHLGGSRAQMALAESEIAAGRHAYRPMVLAATPHLVDAGRIDPQDRRPMWSYVHVPAGSPVDQTDAVIAAVERYAPGFRDIVIAARSVPAARMADYNANLVGGDIAVGGATMWHALIGPTPRLDPWSTPIDRVYLCSSATPPGPGVHGMCGYYAARTILRREFGMTMPNVAP